MLLKDKAQQDELRENGYVIIPLLGAGELANLNEFYSEIHGNEEPPDFIDNIHMTSWCGDPGYKQNISAGLTKIFASPGEHFFTNYRRLNHVFIVKRSGQQTTFKVHQDWSVVDETKHE